MDRNFISVFRSIPLWPNDLIPLDEILPRLLKVIGLDPETASTLGVTTVIGGILGFREIKVHRFDGVTSVTGQIVIATELVLAPFQSYVGIVIGDPAGGTTSFPFSLRIKDEPPIKNNDEIFEIEPNSLDPQLAAFQPVEKNPEAGFLDIDSWRVSLRNIPAKIRILRGVTRVEPLDVNQPALGFRDLPDQHVDVGITLSLDFDADGNLELWPPDPTFTGAEGDPVGALDRDLGWFHVNDSPLYIAASGIGYHRPNTRFPDGFEPPAGLDESWSGFVAQDLGGFWWKKPANSTEEEHIYAINFSDLLVGTTSSRFTAVFYTAVVRKIRSTRLSQWRMPTLFPAAGACEKSKFGWRKVRATSCSSAVRSASPRSSASSKTSLSSLMSASVGS